MSQFETHRHLEVERNGTLNPRKSKGVIKDAVDVLGQDLSTNDTLKREIAKSSSKFEKNMPLTSFDALASYVERGVSKWLHANGGKNLGKTKLFKGLAGARVKDDALKEMHDAAMQLSRMFLVDKSDLSRNVSSYLSATPGMSEFVKRTVGETLHPATLSVSDALQGRYSYAYGLLVYDAVVEWLYDEIPDEHFRADLLESRMRLIEAKSLTKRAIDNLKRNDRVIVYHGTLERYLPDFLNGLDTTKQMKRWYGGPRHAGLFIAPDFKTAKTFGSTRVVIEFETKARNLHGTDYSGRTGRQARRDGEDLTFWSTQYPNSFDGWLSNSLQPDKAEPQALHMGLIRPSDIRRIYWKGEWYSSDEVEGMMVDLGYNKKAEIKNLGVDLSKPGLTIDDLLKALRVANPRITKERGIRALKRVPMRHDTKADFAQSLQYDGNMFGLKLGRMAANNIADQVWSMSAMTENKMLNESRTLSTFNSRAKKNGSTAIKKGLPVSSAEEAFDLVASAGGAWLKRYGMRWLEGSIEGEHSYNLIRGASTEDEARKAFDIAALNLQHKMLKSLFKSDSSTMDSFGMIDGMLEVAKSRIAPESMAGKPVSFSGHDRFPHRLVKNLLYDVAVSWLHDGISDEMFPDVLESIDDLMVRYLSLVENLNEASESELDALARDISRRFGVTFELSRYQPATKYEPAFIELNSIVVPPESRSGGIGTEVMEYFTKWADENNVMIGLDPSSNFGGSVTRLRRFYKRFGFIRNKGRNKDFRTMRAMIRNPKGINESVTEDAPSLLYHVTFLRNLDPVSNKGLVPSQLGGSNYTSAYAGYSRGKVFLTSKAGVRFWMDRMEDVANDQADDAVAEGLIPVVLEIDVSDLELHDDEQGTRDSKSKAFFTKQGVHPSKIRAFDGSRFVDMVRLEVGNLYDAAEDAAEYEEEDGEEYVIPDFGVFMPSSGQLKEAKSSDEAFGDLRSELIKSKSYRMIKDFKAIMDLLSYSSETWPGNHIDAVAPYAKGALLKGFLPKKVSSYMVRSFNNAMFSAFYDMTDELSRSQDDGTVLRDDVIDEVKRSGVWSDESSDLLGKRVLKAIGYVLPSTGMPSALSRIVALAFEDYVNEVKRTKGAQIYVKAGYLDPNRSDNYFTRGSREIAKRLEKHAKDFIGAIIDEPKNRVPHTFFTEGVPVGRVRRVGTSTPYSKEVEKPEPRRRQVLSEDDSIIAYKVMRYDPTLKKAVSGADSRNAFGLRKGKVISMPGKGIFMSPNRSFVVDYYAEHDYNVLLVLSVDPSDITGGSLNDRESEFTARKASIIDFKIADEDNVDDLY